jgi:hypothetical protein
VVGGWGHPSGTYCVTPNQTSGWLSVVVSWYHECSQPAHTAHKGDARQGKIFFVYTWKSPDIDYTPTSPPPPEQNLLLRLY